MSRLKAMRIMICCIILVYGVAATDVSARIEGRWALQTGNIIVGEDISIQKPMAAIFHQQTASISDVENVNIDFPIISNGLVMGPSTFDDGVFESAGGSGAGNLASANIIPFGPVNLALPSIQEDVTQTISTSSTGFFKANWAYIADTAEGNLGSEPLGTHLASGHPFKSPKMLGSEFLWPLMIPISGASAAAGSMMFDMGSLVGAMPQDYPIGSILAHEPVYHTPRVSFYALGNNTSAGNDTATRANNTSAGNDTAIRVNNTAVMGQTTQNASASGNRSVTPTRKPRVNPKATKTEIKNFTMLQRTYRNAFVGSTMHKAYEGPTQYPTWIDPYDNGAGVFNNIDMQKILQVSLKKTRPGERIAPVFWDI